MHLAQWNIPFNFNQGPPCVTTSVIWYFTRQVDFLDLCLLKDVCFESYPRPNNAARGPYFNTIIKLLAVCVLCFLGTSGF